MRHPSGNRVLGLIAAAVFFFGAFFSAPSAAAEAGSGTAMLGSGVTVNEKMKSLAAGTETGYWKETGDILAVRMSDALPEDFVPTEANIVSAPESAYPIYIFFDNQDGAGIMYFYTEGETVAMNPQSGFLFSGNTGLKDISGIAGWNTSGVTNMSGMFANAKSLPDGLDLRNWDTSNVTSMAFMFSGASSLACLDVSNWDTGNVTEMTSMFQVGESYSGNGQLREIAGLEKLDVSNVTNMTCMFYGAGQMTWYDIGGWDVSRVESMNHMFCDNFKLRSLDLSRWDVSSLKTVYCMFDDNISLKTIGDVSRWNTGNLIDAGGWLNECRAFTGDNSGTLDLSGWDTRNLKSAGEMFLHTDLRVIDLSGWTFDSITNDRWEGAGNGIYYETGNGSEKLRGMGSMFKNSANLKTVCISREGLDSFNAAAEREVNMLDMWTGTKTVGFTVK